MPENRLPTAARAAVAGLAMGVAALLPGVGPASDAPAPPSRPDRPTAAAHLGLRVVVRGDETGPGLGTAVVPTGARVRITATVPSWAGRRTVRLQKGPGWSTVGRSTTDRRGVATFAFVAGAAGRTTYRVLAPATGGAVRATGRVTLVVTPVDDGGAADATDAAAAAVVAGPAYSFLDTGRPGAVFRWDPCSAVRYRPDLGADGAAATGALTGAVRQVAQATGLTFVEAGSAGDADLVVVAVPQASDPMLAGPVVGYARITGATWSPQGDARIRSAEIRLEQEYVAGPLADVASVGALLSHELGHAVGLGHSGDAAQVMYAAVRAGSPPAYGTGDLAGLARVGSAGGCLG
ncbi:MAG TPA: matrixin family metalloprotease [Actinomycetes bacterium]|nr:matrixin family metalloprotease [Actinomycetes bacterium]